MKRLGNTGLDRQCWGQCCSRLICFTFSKYFLCREKCTTPEEYCQQHCRRCDKSLKRYKLFVPNLYTLFLWFVFVPKNLFQPNNQLWQQIVKNFQKVLLYFGKFKNFRKAILNLHAVDEKNLSIQKEANDCFSRPNEVKILLKCTFARNTFS